MSQGTNRVVGTRPDTVVAEAFRTLDDPPRPVGPPPLWDGAAARRIVDVLLADRSTRPGPVAPPAAVLAGRRA